MKTDMKADLKNTVIYIARDIERALGMEPSETYRIVANDGEYARTIREKYSDFVLLIESPVLLDTFELLERNETADFLEKILGKNIQEQPLILVFKNTTRIEEFCKSKKWRLLNPSAALAEKIENKITQAEWLGMTGEAGDLASLLPEFKIAPTKDLVWEKKPLVIQFAHGHTGEGTVLVNSQKELAVLQQQFPDRPAKASEFIKGPVFTCNVVVQAPPDTSSLRAVPGLPVPSTRPEGSSGSSPRDHWPASFYRQSLRYGRQRLDPAARSSF
jgi:hypothetical protein